MSDLTRRTFVRAVAATGAALQLPWTLGPSQPAPPAPPAGPPEARLTWLDGRPPVVSPGSAWGVPWPQGALPAAQTFALKAADGTPVPVQSWPIGYWPDGSLKWSAHTVPAGGNAESYVLAPGAPQAPATPLTVQDGPAAIEIDTGVIRVRIGKRGSALVESIVRDGREIAKSGELVCLMQDGDGDGDECALRRTRLISAITAVQIEQRGPVRAVVRIEGVHRAKQGRRDVDALPFSVRLYLHAGGDSLRAVHTITVDKAAAKGFVAGLGIRFRVPMRDQLHDRHVRLAGEGSGVLAEAVRGLTGLRRDPGLAVRQAQVAGRPTPAVETFPATVKDRLQYIPVWGDYSLSQLTSEGFAVRKRTSAGHSWVDIDEGRRAGGLGYVGGISGGLSFGMRDFWQLYPAGLDVRGAGTDLAEATVWMWSPNAKPMDLRFYHDGMGQDTFPKQLEGLAITYEDYEPGFGSAEGVARTTELLFTAHAATPTGEQLAALTDVVAAPPRLVASPQHLYAAGVFGSWSLVDRSTPAKTLIEDHLDFLFDFYRKQVDQRHWFGFWNYGDVMHTYDEDRHTWRYDVGGYGWDNSELATDIWLWYHYLRTGRADAFRVAEAMTRHTGEVDVYHAGKYAMLGTRHNVLHWGDSAKQLRISTAANRRFYYFLTADERVGDLLHALVDADQTFLALDPLRKIRTEPYTPNRNALEVGLGTDWGALAAAWFTEWERGGDPRAKQKLLSTMRGIGALPKGFLTGGAAYNLDTGEFATDRDRVSVSHLSAVFGLAEICTEIIRVVPDEKFEKAWLQYCRLYNATVAEQTAEVGQSLGNLSLRQAHSRLTAYAAARLGDPALADRAWREFYTGNGGYSSTTQWTTTRIDGPVVLNPVDEAIWVSTNSTAQYGLAAIQNLAFVADRIPT